MSNERADARNNQSGFTLVELMIVLAVIGILAATLLPNFQRQAQTAHVAAGMTDMRCLQTAFANYALQNPQAPIPQSMGSYAEVAVFGSANSCVMPDDPDDRRPWDPVNYWCTIVIGGRIVSIPCDSLNPRPQGYELFVQLHNVAPDVAGAVLRLSSDRGIRALTLTQAQQIINDPQF